MIWNENKMSITRLKKVCLETKTTSFWIQDMGKSKTFPLKLARGKPQGWYIGCRHIYNSW